MITLYSLLYVFINIFMGKVNYDKYEEVVNAEQWETLSVDQLERQLNIMYDRLEAVRRISQYGMNEGFEGADIVIEQGIERLKNILASKHNVQFPGIT